MANYKWKISKSAKRKIARYYVDNNSTVRKTAEHFGVSKSYAHKALTEFTMDAGTCNSELAAKVRSQINNNIEARAKRGGLKTKEKYLKRRESVK